MVWGTRKDVRVHQKSDLFSRTVPAKEPPDLMSMTFLLIPVAVFKTRLLELNVIGGTRKDRIEGTSMGKERAHGTTGLDKGPRPEITVQLVTVLTISIVKQEPQEMRAAVRSKERKGTTRSERRKRVRERKGLSKGLEKSKEGKVGTV